MYYTGLFVFPYYSMHFPAVCCLIQCNFHEMKINKIKAAVTPKKSEAEKLQGQTIAIRIQQLQLVYAIKGEKDSGKGLDLIAGQPLPLSCCLGKKD